VKPLLQGAKREEKFGILTSTFPIEKGVSRRGERGGGRSNKERERDGKSRVEAFCLIRGRG